MRHDAVFGILRVMATSGQVIDRFATVLGLAPSALDRVLRPLREGGLAPAGSPGRKSLQGHYEPVHLVNVVLGLAGAQLSEAAGAAAALRPLAWTGSAPSADFTGPLIQGDLGSVLENLITTEDQRLVTALPRLEITLCLNPVEAILDFPPIEPEGSHHSDFYQLPQAELDYGIPEAPPNLRRTTTIRGPVLMAARDLWRDTREWLALKAIGESFNELFAIDDAQRAANRKSKNETGATPGRAAPAKRAQTVETERGGPEQAHPTEKRKNSQPLSSSTAHSSSTFRSRTRAEPRHEADYRAAL